MTSAMKMYTEEFETIYNGSPWYGKPLAEVIAMASQETVFNKPHPEGHSAYEIGRHLLAWRELLVKRLNGDNTASIEVNSEEDWASQPADKNAAAWKNLVQQLEKNQRELVKSLGHWSDEALDKDFAGSGSTLRTHLNGQIQHDIYHIGQIALALKNQ